MTFPCFDLSVAPLRERELKHETENLTHKQIVAPLRERELKPVVVVTIKKYQNVAPLRERELKQA